MNPSIDAILEQIPKGWALKRVEWTGRGYEARLWCPANPDLGAPYRGQGECIATALWFAVKQCRDAQ